MRNNDNDLLVSETFRMENADTGLAAIFYGHRMAGLSPPREDEPQPRVTTGASYATSVLDVCETGVAGGFGCGGDGTTA